MAAITGITTLGIGPTSGANIEHFILFGLNIPEPVILHGDISGGLLNFSHELADVGSVVSMPHDIAHIPTEIVKISEVVR